MRKITFTALVALLIYITNVYSQTVNYIPKYASSGTVPSKLYETSGRIGLNTQSPGAFFHIAPSVNTYPALKATYGSSEVKLLDGAIGVYQFAQLPTVTGNPIPYNFLSSTLFLAQTPPSAGLANLQLGVTGNSVFDGNLGIGSFGGALPSAPLHLKGATFLMEPGANMPLQFTNGSLGGSFEFWVKYDDSAPGGGSGSDAAVSMKALGITKNGIESLKGNFGTLTASTVFATTGLASPVANLTNVTCSSLTAISGFTLPSGAGNGYLLTSNGTGNATWADPIATMPALGFWKQSANQSIYTEAPAVGIGTGAMGDYRLAVNGKIGCKEVKVEVANGIWAWPDYVFEPGYNLAQLSELETYIMANKHLPGIPKQAEVEERGVNVGEMQAQLLKKVEELTLYIIAQQKEIDKLKKALAK